MTFNQYSANFKTWDHVGNITPNVMHSEAVLPAGEFKPAAWLPVGRYDKHYEEYFVVSAGKILAFDRTGRVVPAGLKVAFAATSGNVLSYTAADASEGVIDLTTGVAVSGAVSYTRAQLGAALLKRGLIDAGEAAEDFIGRPVGVAPYNIYKWAGGDGSNPAEYTKHNFNLQHQVAILCKYVISVPLVPAAASQLDLSSVNAIEDTAIDDWAESGGRWKSATALGLTTRYSADVGAAPKNPDVVALVLPVSPLAKSTANSTVVFSSSTDFARERSSIAELSQAGDYFIDYDVGVILCFESGGDAAVASTGTIDYFSYDAAPSTVSTYACAVGDLKPGDLVVADKNSNFAAAAQFAAGDISVASSGNPTDAELAAMLNQVAARQDAIVGQVLEFETHPRDLLEKVRTAYVSLGTADKMPGSATLGLPTALTYSGGADRMVRILLLK